MIDEIRIIPSWVNKLCSWYYISHRMVESNRHNYHIERWKDDCDNKRESCWSLQYRKTDKDRYDETKIYREIDPKIIKIGSKGINFVSKRIRIRLGVKTAVADFVEPSPAGWRKRFHRFWFFEKHSGFKFYKINDKIDDFSSHRN